MKALCCIFNVLISVQSPDVDVAWKDQTTTIELLEA